MGAHGHGHGHGDGLNGMAWHGMAWPGMAWRGMPSASMPSHPRSSLMDPMELIRAIRAPPWMIAWGCTVTRHIYCGPLGDRHGGDAIGSRSTVPKKAGREAHQVRWDARRPHLRFPSGWEGRYLFGWWMWMHGYPEGVLFGVHTTYIRRYTPRR